MTDELDSLRHEVALWDRVFGGMLDKEVETRRVALSIPIGWLYKSITMDAFQYAAKLRMTVQIRKDKSDDLEHE